MSLLAPQKRPAEHLLWAAPLQAEPEFGLEDPLALDYLAQQVGYWLLPALTTRSGQAQYFAMVLYGLDLAERALATYGLTHDDEVRRVLFERWERLWALGVLQSHQGGLRRGHPDNIRGARGVAKAWFAGDKPLPRDYPLISRQHELGGLGAYLVPLRDLGLVYPGSLRVTPAAVPILEAFWGEPGTKHMERFDQWALSVLDPALTKIERAFKNFRLDTFGERSRLTGILGRKAQQDRVFAAVIERAPPPTLALTRLVEAATRLGIDAPRDLLVAMLTGNCGPLDAPLRDLLALALAFGDFAVALRACFDALYAKVTEAGLFSERARILAQVFTPERLDDLRRAARALLTAPELGRLQRLPMHGRVFLHLAEELTAAAPAPALEHLLAFHRRVQRERSSGEGWISQEAGELKIVQSHYTGHRFEARFPAFKLNVLCNLLQTTGRIPAPIGASA